jgi:hypothetical protein
MNREKRAGAEFISTEYQYIKCTGSLLRGFRKSENFYSFPLSQVDISAHLSAHNKEKFWRFDDLSIQ